MPPPVEAVIGALRAADPGTSADAEQFAVLAGAVARARAPLSVEQLTNPPAALVAALNALAALDRACLVSPQRPLHAAVWSGLVSPRRSALARVAP